MNLENGLPINPILSTVLILLATKMKDTNQSKHVIKWEKLNQLQGNPEDDNN